MTDIDMARCIVSADYRKDGAPSYADKIANGEFDHWEVVRLCAAGVKYGRNISTENRMIMTDEAAIEAMAIRMWTDREERQPIRMVRQTWKQGTVAAHAEYRCLARSALAALREMEGRDG